MFSLRNWVLEKDTYYFFMLGPKWFTQLKAWATFVLQLLILKINKVQKQVGRIDLTVLDKRINQL